MKNLGYVRSSVGIALARKKRSKEWRSYSGIPNRRDLGPCHSAEAADELDVLGLGTPVIALT